MSNTFSTTAEQAPTAVAGFPSGQPGHEEIVIRPRKGWIGIDLAELWRYRELLYFLIWRDVKVKYKQTVLGVAWSVADPVVSMIVFTVIFGKLAKISSEGFPYAVFVYAGLLPWNFFSSAAGSSVWGLVSSKQFLTKVYFPRLLIPAARVGCALVDMSFSIAVYAAILVIYGIRPSWGVVFVPVLVLLTAMAAMGYGCLLGALTVVYRDVRHVSKFLVRILMYLSPVVYPVSIVPQRYHWLLALNPMTGIIDAYRSAILGKPWNVPAVLTSSCVTVVLFVFGLLYFRKQERRFADII